MKSVIVGTAGHIDHGKTSLVKALTGIDADRLEEEKRRGITIDIGFAHLDIATGDGEILRLGFVDVPGHERFVRNMLAGIGGIDLVLLVIAADESIKPQTREHFDICRLLSIRRGITILNKADAVDPDTLEVVQLEAEEFLRGSFLDPAHSPVVPVSAMTGAGLDDLKRALVKVASEVSTKDSNALARLPIDRVFSMKGFGTVVTGTLLSGTIRREEDLEIFPGGKRVRVRGIQVHGSQAEQAIAGQRTALNVAGVNVEDLGRGTMVAPPSTFRSTSRVDVSLSLLPSAKPMKDRARVHFHAYTMETVAEVVLYPGPQESGSREYRSKVAAYGTLPKDAGRLVLRPGESAYAQLRLADPALLLPGDRFILRQFSPVVTIGGGLVLNAAVPAKRRASELYSFLSALNSGDAARILRARVAQRGQLGLTLLEAVAETGWTRDVIEKALGGAVQDIRVIRIGERFVEAAAIDALKSLLVKGVTNFHVKNPLNTGCSKESLREECGIPGTDVFEAVLGMLVRERKLEVTGDLVRLPGRAVIMKDDEAESKKMIESAFASAGLKVPFLRDVIAGLKVDKARAQKIVTLLLRDKVLVKVSDELVFHQTALEQLRREVSQYKARSPKIDVGKFKDMTGITRKYAIPLLEYLDRERVTKRVGDERIIL